MIEILYRSRIKDIVIVMVILICVVFIMILNRTILELKRENNRLRMLNGEILKNKSYLYEVYESSIKNQKRLKSEIDSLNKKLLEMNREYNRLQFSYNKLLAENKNYKNIINSISSQGFKKIMCDPNDVTKLSNTNFLQLRVMLLGTKLEGLENYILQAEQRYKVNALFLTALIAHESGWGNSKRAIYDNNLTGYRVYTSASRGERFKNKAECIFKTAELLSRDYLNPNGRWYEGKGIDDINKHYALNKGKHNEEWSQSIKSIIKRIVKFPKI